MTTHSPTIWGLIWEDRGKIGRGVIPLMKDFVYRLPVSDAFWDSGECGNFVGALGMRERVSCCIGLQFA